MRYNQLKMLLIQTFSTHFFPPTYVTQSMHTTSKHAPKVRTGSFENHEIQNPLCQQETERKNRKMIGNSPKSKKGSKIKVQKVKCVTDNHQMNKKEIEERIVTFSSMNEHKL